MIKIENVEVVGWEAAIRSIRNRTDSWDESDSGLYSIGEHNVGVEIGPNDYDLMMRLRNVGTDHHKFMRMITVYVDITAPLYWWEEYNTYDSSCGTMYEITDKEFKIDDFSHGHLFTPDDMRSRDERWDPAEDKALAAIDVDGNICYYTPIGYMKMTCDILNYYRNKYLEAKSKSAEEAMKKYWWQIIQLLPNSYNQKRTVMLNYEVLANMYNDKKARELDEWVVFCKWIEKLPYSEDIIRGNE